MSLLSNSEIKELITESNGWCVSIFMPTHRTGEEIQQNPIRLKNLLGQAEERLVSEGLRRPDVTTLLEPAHELVLDHAFWRHQSDGLALFISSDLFRALRLPLDFEELVLVAPRFHVKPLLPLLSGDGRFYVLALSQKDIRLLQGSRFNVAQVDLTHVPESLVETLRWDDPERRLQWHSGSGQVPGRQAAVFHGHGVATEDDPKDYILRHFQRLDEGLSRVLADDTAPLVLAGVDYLHPLYRQANSYPHLAKEGIEGNPEELSAQTLHERAWEIVAPQFETERETAAAQYQQLAGSGSEVASNQIEEIVPAAYFERVATLFTEVGLQCWGTFNPETGAVEVHDEFQPGDVDLLDRAAVHTYLNGGQVYVEQPPLVPDDESPVAAVLRY